MEKGTRRWYLASVAVLVAIAVTEGDAAQLTTIAMALLALWMAAAQYFGQELHESYTKELDRRAAEREDDFQAVLMDGYRSGFFEGYEDRLAEIVRRSDERRKKAEHPMDEA